MDTKNIPFFRRKRWIIFPFYLVLLGVLLIAYSVPQAKEKLKLIGTIFGDKITGSFNQPQGLFFDEQRQRLYLVDTGNNRLVSFDSRFDFLSEFDAEGRLEIPISLVRSSKGRLIITETKKNQVTIINIKKKRLYPLDLSQVSQGESVIPGSLALDREDNLYIVDRANKRILVFDDTEKYLREITVTEGLTGFNDVKVDREGNVYAIDTLKGRVYTFNKKGELLAKFGKRGNGIEEFDFPVSLAVDRRGLIYVVDQHKNRVLIFNKKGVFQGEFSQLGWREGGLYYPSYIFIDRLERIYVVDRDNDRVQVFKR